MAVELAENRAIVGVKPAETPIRDAKGLFLPGNRLGAENAHLTGRPKADPVVEAFCREQAVEKLQEFLEGWKGLKESSRIRIWENMLDRGFGKAAEFRFTAGEAHVRIVVDK